MADNNNTNNTPPKPPVNPANPATGAPVAPAASQGNPVSPAQVPSFGTSVPPNPIPVNPNTIAGPAVPPAAGQPPRPPQMPQAPVMPQPGAMPPLTPPIAQPPKPPAPPVSPQPPQMPQAPIMPPPGAMPPMGQPPKAPVMPPPLPPVGQPPVMPSSVPPSIAPKPPQGNAPFISPSGPPSAPPAGNMPPRPPQPQMPQAPVMQPTIPPVMQSPVAQPPKPPVPPVSPQPSQMPQAPLPPLPASVQKSLQNNAAAQPPKLTKPPLQSIPVDDEAIPDLGTIKIDAAESRKPGEKLKERMGFLQKKIKTDVTDKKAAKAAAKAEKKAMQSGQSGQANAPLLTANRPAVMPASGGMPPAPPGGGGTPPGSDDQAYRGGNPFITPEHLQRVRRGRARTIVVILAVLAVLSLYVIPLFIDWDSYKQEMIVNVERATGRKMTVDGNIEFSPLPIPNFTLSGIKLANPNTALVPVMMDIESMEAKPSLLALMFGKVRLSHVVLNKVTVELENLEGGVPNWNFSDGRTSAQVIEGENIIANYVGINSLEIKEGKVVLRSGSREAPKVKQLELSEVSVSASSIDGPFDIKGNLKSKALNFEFESEVDNLSGTTPADLKFLLKSGSSSLSIDGTVNDWLTTPAVKGRVVASIDRSIDSLLDYFGINRNVVPKTVLQVLSSKTTEIKGDLFLSSGGFNLTEVKVNSVSTQGSGSVGVTFGKISEVNIKLAFENVDIDKMMEAPAAVPTAATAAAPAADSEPKPAEPPVAKVDVNSLKSFGAGGEVDPKFDLAANIKFALDVTIAKAKFRGQEVTDVDIGVDLGQGSTRVRKLSAQNLPGQSIIDVSGKIYEENQSLGEAQRFDSTIVASGKELLPMIRWLNISFPEIKPGMMRDYQFNANISFTPDRISISEVRLAIDDTYLIGQAVVVKSENPVANSAFKVGRIDLDKYLVYKESTPDDPGFWDKLMSDAQLTQEQRKFDVLRYLNFSYFKNLGISLGADEILYKGGSFKNVVAVSVLRPNLLDVRKVEFESFTGKVSASGMLNTSELVPEIELNFEAEKFDVAYLRDFAPRSPFNPKDLPVWSNKDFFTNRLVIANTKFNLKFGELSIGRLKFNALEAMGTVNSDLIDMPTIRGKFYGGNLDMKGNFALRRQVLNLSYSTTNSDLSQFIREAVGNDAVTAGRFSASGSFQSSGTNAMAMLSTMQGSASMAARGVGIRNFDLTKLGNVDLSKPLEEVERTVDEAFTSGTTLIDYVAGGMTIIEGMIDMPNMAINSATVDKGLMAMKISLPTWQTSSTGTVSYIIKRGLSADTLPFTVKMTGPISEPNIVWDKSVIATKWRINRFGR